jgi:glucosamine-6-phosphate deaminase
MPFSITISPSYPDCSFLAASAASAILRQRLDQQQQVSLVLATGASQFGLLENLVSAPGIAWERVIAFHLDEYAGLPQSHPASFRKYLEERFASQVPLRRFHTVQADAPDLLAECARLETLIRQAPVDLALIGIGENGHLAFNDPPADFGTGRAYLVVDLDQACRQQQVGEGWFGSLLEVPTQAISMSIPQIMQSRAIICTVPDLRKAQAVRCALLGPVTPGCPASILRNHSDCQVFLDQDSASLVAPGLLLR